jgi:hypothetical protein
VTSTSTTVTTIQTIQGCYYSGTCTGITFTACPSGEVCGNGAALCGGPDSCCFHTCQSTTTITSTTSTSTTVTTIQTIQGCYYSGTCTGITFTGCPSGEVCGNGAAVCDGSCCLHTCQSTTTTTSTSTATTTASCSGTCCVNPSAPAYGTCGTTTCPC